MAEISTIARPYAEALFKAVVGDQRESSVQQLNALAQFWGNAQVQTYVENPSVASDDVVSLLLEPLQSASEAVRNFVRILVENKRLRALPEIASQFDHLVRRAKGAQVAVVESPFAMDDAQLQALQPMLETRFGTKLELQVQLNPTLIGGVRVSVGDEVLDTSVLARLSQLRAALTA